MVGEILCQVLNIGSYRIGVLVLSKLREEESQFFWPQFRAFQELRENVQKKNEPSIS